MSMRCKQCAESFPKNQPFDVFELRRSKVLPADAEALTSSVMLEDGGLFCSRKCLGDYLKSGDKSGVFDLGSLRKRLDDQK
jgi:hypothetical protein